MFSLELMLELTYWTPLVTLLLSSLGLVVLKRVSGLPAWVERLAAPPFYFVSLPIATLLVGIEMLGWYVLVSYANGWFRPYSYGWLIGIAIQWSAVWGELPDSPVEALLYGASFVVFVAALLVSGYVLWRTLCRDGQHEYPSKAKQVPRALLLLLAFAWAFLCMRSFVLFLRVGW